MTVQEVVKGNIIKGPNKWDLIIKGLAGNDELVFEVLFPWIQVVNVKIIGAIALDGQNCNYSWLVMGQLVEYPSQDKKNHNFQFPTYFHATYSTMDRKGTIWIKEFDINGPSPFDPPVLFGW